MKRPRPEKLERLRKDVRLDLVGIGELVHLVEKTNHSQDFPQSFLVQAELLDGGSVAIDAIAAGVGHPPEIPVATGPVLERLPPFLKGLLREFCWRAEPDLVNALGLLLTGLLINHFVDDSHPIAIIDGNQPGLGKTILVQAIGRILDGFETPRIPLVRDEELEKKLCAQLLDGRSSLFFFDNVRDRIESPLIEANALSPLLCFRILGRNATVSRPNAYLWVVTSNLSSGTSDFLRRGLPIRLHYEGDPKKRIFTGRPLEYVSQHRLEILGELAGLVLRWQLQGMPSGKGLHRCARWAEVIGGILEANGIEQFLANLEEAEAAMDEGLEALATLAEFVVVKGKTEYFTAADGRVFTIYSFDAETTDIDDERSYLTPAYVLGAACDGHRGVYITRDNISAFFESHKGVPFVFHNAAFDLKVVDALLKPKLDIYQAVDANLVWDTLILKRLYSLATAGHTARGEAGLADCAREHLGVTLDKGQKDSQGHTVRTSFSQFLGKPPSAIPAGAERLAAFLSCDLPSVKRDGVFPYPAGWTNCPAGRCRPMRRWASLGEEGHVFEEQADAPSFRICPFPHPPRNKPSVLSVFQSIRGGRRSARRGVSWS